ncbi:hypothetical protein B0A50_05738 [Salinomyces thailandicus]|uniref:FCP1 homology domain-containing protein n=1 Tax=Salinomyces thailandicus TaxID=706561 RepID=A0A4U0TRI9_9PEZI|nr:hypothetical protein B0A50_05738 [Salinomyces thailandica]
MNSLNIVSRLTTTPPPSPPRSRTSSSAHVRTLKEEGDDEANSGGQGTGYQLDATSVSEKLGLATSPEDGVKQEQDEMSDEKTPLLEGSASGPREQQRPGSASGSGSRLWSLPRRVTGAILYGATVVFSTITAPGRYVIACFYDEEGHFSAILPLKNFRNLLSRRRRKSTVRAMGFSNVPEQGRESDEHEKLRLHQRKTSRRSPSVDSNASSVSASSAASSSSDNEADKLDDSPARHTRSKAAAATMSQPDEIAPHRKSGRVKLLHNDEALRKRKSARAAAAKRMSGAANPDDVATVANALKSPSSPSVNTKHLTRYPRTPAPPRPLVPRRQPSYTLSYSTDAPKKTLVIDLDETLIHSMAKGGRMSTGHMVEVRLGGPVSSSGVSLGPGVPILYYVHERPGCHEFLRKVAKWYNLIAFTASVQEYADPVVDWLERERKYFSGRYYRQHCTLRNGAYIKDLSQVEPDLSKVMILDNSPMSYIFHEDNAIPIEGWISDPTDNDLLHLVPLLEGLQYVTDVRALLALRQGQAQHT